jgi:hypothetical protein
MLNATDEMAANVTISHYNFAGGWPNHNFRNLTTVPSAGLRSPSPAVRAGKQRRYIPIGVGRRQGDGRLGFSLFRKAAGIDRAPGLQQAYMHDRQIAGKTASSLYQRSWRSSLYGMITHSPQTVYGRTILIATWCFPLDVKQTWSITTNFGRSSCRTKQHIGSVVPHQFGPKDAARHLLTATAPVPVGDAACALLCDRRWCHA